jgi:ribonuclease VapC
VTIDTSAVVAIMLDEPEREAFGAAIAAAPKRRISSVSYCEAAIVLSARRGEAAVAELDLWIEAADIEIAPFTAEHARIARRAYAVFGKGRHLAGLNFGDCASYALAAAGDESLLFKGNDFLQTDIRSAE